ncbi:GDYXXLXY domain-containing protein [Erythrobacter litoralis]|uniref:GDYXXLXY domain-containing protein n=1 Tax=Erythrobacter litoralis (strain HTCC2594) TaxID=314225 RepID=Q2N779_ERYLH|nr:GDYXXLXY domain-containing protein [Erythrobacter litoralis]ABC64462.1 hypothetical protein ELI_11850 [Erythrobacter litoralis HTCC2594]
MMRAASLLALALPVIGLGGLWAWTESWSREGTDWDVPVAGYDPRDLLRGHYIEFTYDWAGDDLSGASPDAFCIEGEAPEIARIVARDDVESCAHFARADYGSVYGGAGLQRGRLYVPQTQARELEDKLRDPDLRGIVTVRQRIDGRILPQSIRFEELTEEERLERERQREEERRRSVPDIMVAPD